MLKGGLIPTRTVEEEAFWRLWRHDSGIIVTWRHRWRHHSTAPGYSAPNRNQLHISYSFRDIWPQIFGHTFRTFLQILDEYWLTIRVA